MPTKKGQRLTMKIIDEAKDFFGVIEVTILLNGKVYTYPITSAYALEKAKRLLRCKHPKVGKALHVLGLFKLTGFNSFEEEANVRTNTSTTRLSA